VSWRRQMSRVVSSHSNSLARIDTTLSMWPWLRRPFTGRSLLLVVRWPGRRCGGRPAAPPSPCGRRCSRWRGRGAGRGDASPDHLVAVRSSSFPLSACVAHWLPADAADLEVATTMACLAPSGIPVVDAVAVAVVALGELVTVGGGQRIRRGLRHRGNPPNGSLLGPSAASM
jgi:hypothetical protein